jgi:hypothetical protein
MTQRKADSRSVSLGAKFSRSEADQLRQQARVSGTTVSSLIHQLVTTGEVHPRPHIDPIAIEQWRALAPVAANLNQLTRKINQGQLCEPPEVEQELLALRCVLEEIRNQLIGEQGRAA